MNILGNLKKNIPNVCLTVQNLMKKNKKVMRGNVDGIHLSIKKLNKYLLNSYIVVQALCYMLKI